MANTYCQIYIQATFAVKYRDTKITTLFENDLHKVIGTLINNSGCKTILVNGVDDHIHCFFSLKPTVAISKLMQVVKSSSSRFVNENYVTYGRFEWQDGFGAFSYNHSQKENVFNYVKNQKSHHNTTTFLDEYKLLLDEFEIPYEHCYLFDDLR